jgi:cytochrome b
VVAADHCRLSRVEERQELAAAEGDPNLALGVIERTNVILQLVAKLQHIAAVPFRAVVHLEKLIHAMLPHVRQELLRRFPVQRRHVVDEEPHVKITWGLGERDAEGAG